MILKACSFNTLFPKLVEGGCKMPCMLAANVITWIIEINEVQSLIYSGVIGFLLCSKDGPPVDFTNPINPIEKLEGATSAGREIKFYNSEVCIILYSLYLQNVV